MSSGSKRPKSAKSSARDGTPELRPWQIEALDVVASSKLASEVALGGGAALSALYLHHRRSEDLDFFLMRELEPGELRPVTKSLSTRGVTLQEESVGPRQSLILLRDSQEFGRIDFAFYPYEPIARRKRWRGLAVESLLDMTVNKTQALLTRFQPRDFVDLYFLLREGEERDVNRLLDLVRAKFDVGADRLALARRMLMASQIRELPALLREVTIDELVRFFEDQARAILRRG